MKLGMQGIIRILRRQRGVVRPAAAVVLGALLLAGGCFLPAPAMAATTGAETWPALVSNPIGFEGGIRNEYIYQEVIFVTGRPLVVSGEMKFSGGRAGRDGTTTQSYSYKLENKEQGVKVSRSVTLEVSETSLEGQTSQVSRLKNFSETITVTGAGAKDTYKLVKDGYQFNQSAVFDHCPAVDFFSGNWSSRKVYEINKGDGTLTVDMQGETVGYNHYWGSTETRRVNCYLSSSRTQTAEGGEGEDTETVEWDGTVQTQVSFNRTKNLAYQESGPSGISFSGGYDLLEQEENVLQYSYNLPYIDDSGALVPNWRNEDTQSMKLLTVPRHQRLPVFTMKDIRGHWAEEEIERLVSVGAFSPTLQNFGPGLDITRGDFARAVAGLTNMQPPAEPTRNLRGSRAAASEQSPFADVPVTHPAYQQIKEMVRRGAIQGVRTGMFNPGGYLTRAEAAAILVRSLGFEGLAPNPSYRTRYLDDSDIPSWARDAVYVSTELGLVKGFGEPGSSYYRFLPQETLSRAEAAVLLDGLREYLMNDMKKDYRDRLLSRR